MKQASPSNIFIQYYRVLFLPELAEGSSKTDEVT